jgi:hypothetical protein
LGRIIEIPPHTSATHKCPDFVASKHSGLLSPVPINSRSAISIRFKVVSLLAISTHTLMYT